MWVRLPPSAPYCVLKAPAIRRKNVLLINPWIYDFTAYDFWLKPLGLLLVAAVLEKQPGLSLSLIDCLDRHHPGLGRSFPQKPDGRGAYLKAEVPKPSLLKDIPRKYCRYGIPLDLLRQELDRVPVPQAVLVTGLMTYWYPGVQAAVDVVRRKFGSVPILLGGIYPTLEPEHARRHSGADIVVTGPGEKAVLPALAAALGDFDPDGLDDDSAGEWPEPAFGLLGNHQVLPLLTSRGCPLSCTFCAASRLHPRFEQKPAAQAYREIIRARERWSCCGFAFYDDALLVRRRTHFIPLLLAVIRSGLSFAFHTPNGLPVRDVDAELARLLRRAGFERIFLSQESLDPAFLEAHCPKVEPGDLERALSCLEAAGYPRGSIQVYLMAGLPGQDLAAARDSVRRVQSLGARPYLAWYSPVPGTPDYEHMVRSGALPEGADPLLHNKVAVPYLGAGFSPEDVDRLQSLARSPAPSR